ncbi:hypothetical protein NP233_g1213 [Leucocoprinus birnbaumii]|uniref:Pseudouridine synthase RsuA/RluA-like domain-containing protein n=1 Tax=Leucocoprinus birnbaumii TaxID=56174 RepID=A0AAD5W1G7_9AGAR|nr:hypothetical protein NP233_g1213 [Leucocoprinus birnbaumii]
MALVSKLFRRKPKNEADLEELSRRNATELTGLHLNQVFKEAKDNCKQDYVDRHRQRRKLHSVYFYREEGYTVLCDGSGDPIGKLEASIAGHNQSHPPDARAIRRHNEQANCSNHMMDPLVPAGVDQGLRHTSSIADLNRHARARAISVLRSSCIPSGMQAPEPRDQLATPAPTASRPTSRQSEAEAVSLVSGHEPSVWNIPEEQPILREHRASPTHPGSVPLQPVPPVPIANSSQYSLSSTRSPVDDSQSDPSEPIGQANVSQTNEIILHGPAAGFSRLQHDEDHQLLSPITPLFPDFSLNGGMTSASAQCVPSPTPLPDRPLLRPSSHASIECVHPAPSEQVPELPSISIDEPTPPASRASGVPLAVQQLEDLRDQLRELLEGFTKVPQRPGTQASCIEPPNRSLITETALEQSTQETSPTFRSTTSDPLSLLLPPSRVRKAQTKPPEKSEAKVRAQDEQPEAGPSSRPIQHPVPVPDHSAPHPREPACSAKELSLVPPPPHIENIELPSSPDTSKTPLDLGQLTNQPVSNVTTVWPPPSPQQQSTPSRTQHSHDISAPDNTAKGRKGKGKMRASDEQPEVSPFSKPLQPPVFPPGLPIPPHLRDKYFPNSSSTSATSYQPFAIPSTSKVPLAHILDFSPLPPTAGSDWKPTSGGTGSRDSFRHVRTCFTACIDLLYLLFMDLTGGRYDRPFSEACSGLAEVIQHLSQNVSQMQVTDQLHLLQAINGELQSLSLQMRRKLTREERTKLYRESARSLTTSNRVLRELSKPPQQAYPDAPDPSMLPPPQFSSPASSASLLDTRKIGTSGSMTTNIDQAGTEPSLLFASSEFISTAQGSQGNPQTNFQAAPRVQNERSRFINLFNRSSQPASYVLNRTQFSDSGRLHTQKPEDFWLLPREPGAATNTREGTQSRSEGDTCENIRQPHQQTTKTPSAISHFSAPLPASTSVPATAALAQETVDRSPVPRTSRQSQTPPLTFPTPIQPERSTEPTIQRNGPLPPTLREGGQIVTSRVHEDVQELSSLASMDRLSNWPIMDVVPEQSLLMKPQVVELPPGLQQSSLLREPKLKKLRMTSEQKDVMTVTGSILLALDLDPRCGSYASSSEASRSKEPLLRLRFGQWLIQLREHITSAEPEVFKNPDYSKALRALYNDLKAVSTRFDYVDLLISYTIWNMRPLTASSVARQKLVYETPIVFNKFDNKRPFQNKSRDSKYLASVHDSPALQLEDRHTLKRSTRDHLPHIQLPTKDHFRQTIISLIQAAMADTDADQSTKAIITPIGLRKTAPYWYPYTTMVKMRWIGRELLEVVSTEFRDRSMEYYRYALESGVTTVNGKIARPDTTLRDGDRIENVVHRHEPPVTSRPVKVLYQDFEREFIVVDKPGSIPVHASGRYYKNTLIEILVNEFGFQKVYPINRLDRLTSGLMIIPLSPDRARELQTEFVAGTVQKEYVARCKGRFPDSIVRCRPLTGRSHQLRVHLQFLGHPIANDPIYSEQRIWGENIGKGGIDITPTEERTAPAPPDHLQNHVDDIGNPESLSKDQASTDMVQEGLKKTKLLPRETGEDIGMGSPVPLSKEAVGVITRLRNMKDEDEDWSRWRDVIFRAKGALSPSNLTVKPPPPPNRRKRGGKGEFASRGSVHAAPNTTSGTTTPAESRGATPDASLAPSSIATPSSSGALSPIPALGSVEQPPQLTTEEALEKISQMEPLPDPNTVVESEHLYCPECYLPLHPDPKPEKLYIFLHALKYTTSLGAYETEMPEWAAEGFEWDRS